jgi:hypothetical protein
MRFCSRLALCSVLVLASTAAARQAPNLAGSYQCVGDAGNGKQYKGTVEITREGDCYRLKWDLAPTAYTGLGILDGNQLAVAIRAENDPKYTGVINYKLGPDGRLSGRWSTFGSQGATLSETLTPSGARP